MNLNLILSDIYCKINALKENNLTVLWDGSTIELDTKGVNFTGSAISNIFTTDGIVTVQVDGGEQFQADWTQEDTSEPSYIHNKPTPTDLIFTGNVTTTQTGPNEVTVDILGGGTSGFTYLEEEYIAYASTWVENKIYPDITELSIVKGNNIDITSTFVSPNRVRVEIGVPNIPIPDIFWSRIGNAGTNAYINFLGTTDNVALTIRTNNIDRFTFDNTYTNLSSIGGSLYLNGGNTTLGAALNNGNIGIGISSGNKALGSATVSAYNTTAIGARSFNISNGHDNVGVGIYAGAAIADGDYNTAIGPFALRSSTYFAQTGPVSFNVAIGLNALRVAQYSLNTIAIGPGVMEEAKNSVYNIALGQWTGYSIDGGQYNTLIGNGAGNLLTSGSRNVVIGGNSNFLYSNPALTGSDSDNVFVGDSVAGERGGGNKNTIIGNYAAANVISGGRMRGERNVIIGYRTGSTTNDTNSAIIIGANVAPVDSNGSGQLNIGNLIYGLNGQISTDDNSVNTPTVNGKIGIGVQTPSAILDLRASTTLEAVMRLRVGSAPATPNDGDIWLESNTSTGLKIRLNGTTYTINLV